MLYSVEPYFESVGYGVRLDSEDTLLPKTGPTTSLLGAKPFMCISNFYINKKGSTRDPNLTLTHLTYLFLIFTLAMRYSMWEHPVDTPY
jgi:hypothetical protein